MPVSGVGYTSCHESRQRRRDRGCGGEHVLAVADTGRWCWIAGLVQCLARLRAEQDDEVRRVEEGGL